LVAGAAVVGALALAVAAYKNRQWLRNKWRGLWSGTAVEAPDVTRAVEVSEEPVRGPVDAGVPPQVSAPAQLTAAQTVAADEALQAALLDLVLAAQEQQPRAGTPLDSLALISPDNLEVRRGAVEAALQQALERTYANTDVAAAVLQDAARHLDAELAGQEAGVAEALLQTLQAQRSSVPAASPPLGLLQHAARTPSADVANALEPLACGGTASGTLQDRAALVTGAAAKLQALLAGVPAAQQVPTVLAVLRVVSTAVLPGTGMQVQCALAPGESDGGPGPVPVSVRTTTFPSGQVTRAVRTAYQQAANKATALVVSNASPHFVRRLFGGTQGDKLVDVAEAVDTNVWEALTRPNGQGLAGPGPLASVLAQMGQAMLAYAKVFGTDKPPEFDLDTVLAVLAPGTHVLCYDVGDGAPLALPVFHGVCVKVDTALAASQGRRGSSGSFLAPLAACVDDLVARLAALGTPAGDTLAASARAAQGILVQGSAARDPTPTLVGLVQAMTDVARTATTLGPLSCSVEAPLYGPANFARKPA
jgi:hypothetical protein